MDETRSKRISEHFAYMRARIRYQRDFSKLLQGWRIEVNASKLGEEAAERQRKGQELRDEAARLQELLRERRAEQLRAELRKAELDHKRVRWAHKFPPKARYSCAQL